jgi:hypothetical protein
MREFCGRFSGGRDSLLLYNPRTSLRGGFFASPGLNISSPQLTLRLAALGFILAPLRG